MVDEFDQFTQRLSDIINHKIHQFGLRLTLLEDTLQTSQDIGPQAREVLQAIVEQVNKVEGQIMTIRSTLKIEACLA